ADVAVEGAAVAAAATREAQDDRRIARARRDAEAARETDRDVEGVSPIRERLDRRGCLADLGVDDRPRGVGRAEGPAGLRKGAGRTARAPVQVDRERAAAARKGQRGVRLPVAGARVERHRTTLR